MPTHEVWLAVVIRGYEIEAHTEREAVRLVRERLQKLLPDDLGIDGVTVGEASQHLPKEASRE